MESIVLLGLDQERKIGASRRLEGAKIEAQHGISKPLMCGIGRISNNQGCCRQPCNHLATVVELDVSKKNFGMSFKSMFNALHMVTISLPFHCDLAHSLLLTVVGVVRRILAMWMPSMPCSIIFARSRRCFMVISPLYSILLKCT